MTVDDDTRHLGPDRVLDLALGLLPLDADRSARAHIAVCADCEARVRAQAARVEETRADYEIRAVERDVLGREHEPAGGRAVAEGTSVWSRLIDALRQPLPALGAGLAAAAGLLWISLSVFQTRDPWLAQLTALPPISSEVVVRSGAQWPAELARGLDAYTNGKLDEAIDALESPSISEDWHIMRSIYLSSALARTARYERAVQVLAEIETTAFPDPWHGEALWTLYVALRATNRDARADDLLRTLADRPGAARERARNELDTRGGEPSAINPDERQ